MPPHPPGFKVGTAKVDVEISTQAGPQLVVPITNARYALNAANARWGSLYDALYGTDALARRPGAKGYDSGRGGKVIAWGRAFLDRIAPLAGASHQDVNQYFVESGALRTRLADGGVSALSDPAGFAGYVGAASAPNILLLVHHGLHVEIHVDRANPIGRTDPAGVSDIMLEAALTAIQDCEDSVAAVDADDKVLVYRNWLGLMTGKLEATFDKGGKPDAPHGAGSDLYVTRWRRANPARPRAFAGAQCRTSDDQ